MLLSKFLFTILVTIVFKTLFKPCETVHNINKLNEVKYSFLQNDGKQNDNPVKVTSGETVEVASNKVNTSGGNGDGKNETVESKTSVAEVHKHHEDSSGSHSNETSGVKNEHSESKDDKNNEGSDSKSGSDNSHDHDQKDKNHQESEVKEHEEDSGKSNDHSVEHKEEKVNEHGSESKTSEHEHSEHQHVAEHSGHSDEHEHDEHEDDEDEDHYHHEDHHGQLSESSSTQNAEGSKEEHSQQSSGTEEFQPSEGKKEEDHTVASEQPVSEHGGHSDEQQKEPSKEDHSESVSPEQGSQQSQESSVSPAEQSPQVSQTTQSEVKEHQPDTEHGGHSDEHDSESKTSEHEHSEHQHVAEHQDKDKSNEDDSGSKDDKNNSEESQKEDDSESKTPVPLTETSVSSQAQSAPAQSKEPDEYKVDVKNLTEAQKESVKNFYEKPDAFCSVDCAHSCKSQLGGTTQCVSQTGSTVSCSTFDDANNLTCPTGYSPCVQPNVTSLKSFTLKNDGVEVGLLEVDGSNFNKCMGLVFAPLNGSCEKKYLVHNLLFTSGVLNLDHQAEVGSNKLTFSNLKMENGEYRVCVFQRYKPTGDAGMLSQWFERFLEFVNPTHTHSQQVKAVFSMEVGTLRVSD